MTDTPTFAVLKLLTDEEIERGLAVTYSMQAGAPDERPYLRSDIPDTSEYCNSLGLCFLGVALGMPTSPSSSVFASALRRQGRIPDDQWYGVKQMARRFMEATDQTIDWSSDNITSDEQLRAVVKASRAQPS